MSTPPWGQQPDEPQPYDPYGQTQDYPQQPPQQPQYPPYGVPYGSPYGGQPWQGPPRTNGMAIASLVVSVVSLVSFCLCGFTSLAGVVGAILGHVSRRQIRQRGEQGAGLALAGVIVGWISFAVGLAVIVFVVVLLASGEDFSSPGYA